MFDTLALWAAGLARPDRAPADQRPATLQNAEFDLSRIRSDFFGDSPAYRQETAARLYWVTDLDHLPADIDPNLVRSFLSAFPRGGFDPANRAFHRTGGHSRGPGRAGGDRHAP